MLGGNFDCTLREGNVAKGTVQNGNGGRLVWFSAKWDGKRWTVSFTSGTQGICASRLALLGQKVAESLSVPEAA